MNGHDVNCPPDVFDEATYRQAGHGLRTRAAGPAAQHTARLPEKPVAPRTPPPISNRLKPRLATALFRRYLRACIPTDPDHTSPLAGARPEAALAETPARRAAPPPLTVHRPGGACPTPPPTR
ncbi:hypothetical protein [Streptomyces soliscabiei]|uniref:hypothetical protein n=1 Tax=Streptomyces soliscabiei TaxID=588897 RepID=UPI0029A43074|nr:hypothetical protein [Streptomyces sp. NY05-11A]MDX2683240.1 hypothetical protein [Streptomyces sp. NY05-11A]